MEPQLNKAATDVKSTDYAVDDATLALKRLENIRQLEEKLRERSEQLEERHMQAAMDALLTDTNTSHSRANPIVARSSTEDSSDAPLFDDYVNPDAVTNCLSPYEPTNATKIAAVISFLENWWMSQTEPVKNDGYLLDIGCGDGRVCVATAQCLTPYATLAATSTRGPCFKGTIGLDVSPLCIDQARELANEEGLGSNTSEKSKYDDPCLFFEADATMDPDELLAGEYGEKTVDERRCANDDLTLGCVCMFSTDSSALSLLLKNVTCVFLYTYPTLLVKLVPLLVRLTRDGRLTAVVTLTYHFKDEDAHFVVERADTEHDIRLYTSVKEC